MTPPVLTNLSVVFFYTVSDVASYHDSYGIRGRRGFPLVPAMLLPFLIKPQQDLLLLVLALQLEDHVSDTELVS